MTGETDLERLLADPRPDLDPIEYVFCTLSADDDSWIELQPVAMIQEAEGRTVVLPAMMARSAGLPDQPRFRRITLNVHSSLEAVGFIANLAGRLAAAGISTNPLSGYFHDHLFVPTEQAEMALIVLGARDD
ncbi:MAG: ACT domain-containing protein [Xanthomonadales bacterium]|nr:ACT domain-containing protein [Xanthomonadales bacterium]